MKIKILTLFFLLLFFPQFPLNILGAQDETLIRKGVDYKPSQSVKTRSPELTLTGYFEDGSLFLFFNKNLDDSKVYITDVETGSIVFEQQVSENVLVVPFLNDSSSEFRIDIVNGGINVSGKIYLN